MNKRILQCIVLGVISAGTMAIPFLSVPAVLVSYPLLTLEPFRATGVDVEYVFLSVVLKSPRAWLLFSVYFSVLYYFVFFVKNLLDGKKSAPRGSDMSFERAICTDELFANLRLPEILRSQHGDTLGNEIIFNRASEVVLIPNSYCHADYPDRIFKFYVRGEYFAASQWIGHRGEKDRIELTFEAETDSEKIKAIVALFAAAIRLIENDSNLPLPITWRKNKRKRSV